MEKIKVSSEVGTLKRLIIHSPDAGMNKVMPSKTEESLFDDIVHLKSLRKNEYDMYLKILLYFLDKKKVENKIKHIDEEKNKRSFYKPMKKEYFNSSKVIDVQKLLMNILEDEKIKGQLIASISAVEHLSHRYQNQLFQLSASDLANTCISGILPGETSIFRPIPNFIFTRDIATIINEHIILTKFNKPARQREGLLSRYIFYHHPYFVDYRDKIIEIENDIRFFMYSKKEKKSKYVSIEGGDIMTVAPNHIIIGCSERSTLAGVDKLIDILFNKKIIEKASVIFLPKLRSYMHLDTIFTQVRRNTWVLFSELGNIIDNSIYLYHKEKKQKKIAIMQFHREKKAIHKLHSIEELLDDISQKELNSTQKTEFIYSGQGKYLFGKREQWTDSCNLLALREGVVIGYERNENTILAFQEKGYAIQRVEDLLDAFEKGEQSPQDIKNTLIILSSGELSRARGGTHCMSLPILREEIDKPNDLI